MGPARDLTGIGSSSVHESGLQRDGFVIILIFYFPPRLPHLRMQMRAEFGIKNMSSVPISVILELKLDSAHQECQY